jgi:hypothetical protein
MRTEKAWLLLASQYPYDGHDLTSQSIGITTIVNRIVFVS